MLNKTTGLVFLLAGLSLVSAFLLIIPGFPFLGLAFCFLWFAITLGMLKLKCSKYEMLLLLISLPLSIFIVFRSNPVVVLLDIATNIMLLSVVLYRHKNHLSFKELVLSPI